MIQATKNYLGLLLLLSLPMASAFAQPNLTVGTASGMAGATVNTPVSFANNGAVVAMSFYITYDPALVTPGTLVPGASMPANTVWTTIPPKEPGTLRVVVTPFDVSSEPYPKPPLPTVKDGVLFTIPWTITTSTTSGSASLTAANVTFANAQAAAVSAGTLTNGQITIGVASVPDVNVDGSVDVGDIMAIINHIFQVQVLTTADVNNDGSVDVGDIMYIINYIFSH